MKRATTSPVQQKPPTEIRVQEPLAEPVMNLKLVDTWQCLIAMIQLLSKEDPKLAAKGAELLEQPQMPRRQCSRNRAIVVF
ncbi:hypothetical protein DIPPA_03670 [Diplonema papillatum]|nr:hypothetical protein DIPPA_03670 [Diplonema papillatum]